jgi:hypothetical protein
LENNIEQIPSICLFLQPLAMISNPPKRFFWVENH